MKRFTLALDLKDDPGLIAEYEQWHTKERIWPEITASIINAGIISMQIYRTGNRLFMIMETDDDFSFGQKAAGDENNAKVQHWEELMWKFQQPLPWAAPGQKWVLMDKIFEI